MSVFSGAIPCRDQSLPINQAYVSRGRLVRLFPDQEVRNEMLYKAHLQIRPNSFTTILIGTFPDYYPDLDDQQVLLRSELIRNTASETLSIFPDLSSEGKCIQDTISTPDHLHTDRIGLPDEPCYVLKLLGCCDCNDQCRSEHAVCIGHLFDDCENPLCPAVHLCSGEGRERWMRENEIIVNMYIDHLADNHEPTQVTVSTTGHTNVCLPHLFNTCTQQHCTKLHFPSNDARKVWVQHNQRSINDYLDGLLFSCPICLMGILDGVDLFRCKHPMCRSCATAFLADRTSNQCPYCRSSRK